MDSSQLTREQFDKLSSKLRPILREVNALHKRADKGLDPGDVLLERISEATDAAHRLWVDLHYRACGKDGGHEGRH